MNAVARWICNAPQCRRCSFRLPSGECRDPAMHQGRKSGRCGGYVWYVVGSQQRRRLYVVPRDRLNKKQRRWRARFAAASKKYSGKLTDAQQNACIAAGAKRKCRRRLGPSGNLTGHQYWMRKEYRAQAKERRLKAEWAAEVAQIQGLKKTSKSQLSLRQRLARSTSGPHAGRTGPTADPHRSPPKPAPQKRRPRAR